MAALLGGIRLFLVPTMNPDGFKRTGVWTRENANRVDLNRNFPGRQLETSPRQMRGLHADAPCRSWSATALVAGTISADWIREGLGPSRGRGGNEALAITNIQQPETVAMMRWAHETRFVGSCVLHEVRQRAESAMRTLAPVPRPVSG